MNYMRKKKKEEEITDVLLNYAPVTFPSMTDEITCDLIYVKYC